MPQARETRMCFFRREMIQRNRNRCWQIQIKFERNSFPRSLCVILITLKTNFEVIFRCIFILHRVSVWKWFCFSNCLVVATMRGLHVYLLRIEHRHHTRSQLIECDKTRSTSHDTQNTAHVVTWPREVADRPFTYPIAWMAAPVFHVLGFSVATPLPCGGRRSSRLWCIQHLPRRSQIEVNLTLCVFRVLSFDMTE